MSETPNNNVGIKKCMGYIAVLVATIAALAALFETQMNRQHQTISVWPYLQIWPGINLNEKLLEGEEAFSFNIANKGVGPAILEKLDLKYKGKSYISWYTLSLEVAKKTLILKM